MRGLLVSAGLLATALATVAALVAGDSLERLFVSDAVAQWGDVDVMVLQPGEATIEEGTARFAAVEGAGRSDGWSGRLVLDAVATSGSRREPAVRVLGLSAEEKTLTPPLMGEGQLDYLTLEPEQVIVNRRLAERSGVSVGDRIDLVIAAPETSEEVTGGGEKIQEAAAHTWRPTVVGVADDVGLADSGRTPNVITRLDSLQRITNLPGRVSALYVSARAEGRDEADELAEDFEEVGRLIGVVAITVKEDALDIARDEGGLFRGILMTLALLVVGASAAVTANLIVLLGQERSREVAVLRALGARPRVVQRLLVWEAAVYAIVASVVGALLALPFAGWLARTISDHFASINAGRGREQVELVLDARLATVATGVLLVVLVALGTARAAARRVAGMDLESSLRGAAPTLAPPDRSDRRVRNLAAAGLLTLGMGLTAGDGGDLLRFLGLTLLLTALWVRERHRVAAGAGRDRVDTRASSIGLAWFLAAPAVLGDFSQGVQSSFGLFTIAGAGAVACATVLATARLPQIMRLLRLYLPAGRVQAPLRTAGAFAGYNRTRSGTVIVAIASVLFMVAALAVLGSATDVSVDRQRGGYDVVGTAPVPLDVRALEETSGIERITALRHAVIGESSYATEDDDGEESTVPYPVRAVSLTSGFIEEQRFGLVDALPEYPDAAAALSDALTGGGVVVDRYSRPEGAKPGDDVVIDDGRGPRTFELLAVLDTFVLNAALFGPDDYDSLFRSRGPTFLLAAASTGTAPEDAAAALSDAAAAHGLVAQSVEQASDEVVRINRTFTDVFAILLQLGLAVALVAVGVLLARAMRERRAGLSVLRAVGFRRRDVIVMLVAEPLLQTLVGCAIGLGVGLGVLWLLFTTGFADLAFVVSWRQIGVTLAGVLTIVAAASLGPAIAGARKDPAAGLRDFG